MMKGLHTLVGLAALGLAILAGARLALANRARSAAIQRTIPLAGSAVVVDAPAGRAFVVNSGDNSVSVLDSRTGVLVRRVGAGGQNPGALRGTVAVDSCSGRLFMSTSSTTVGVLDVRAWPLAGLRPAVSEAHVAATVRTIALPGPPGALAVDARRCRAFVVHNWEGTSAGGVSVVDTRHLAVLHDAVVGYGARAIAVDERTGRAFVVNTGDDTLSVLDGGSGRLLRTIQVGWEPFAVAVDGRARRVLVLEQGTTWNGQHAGVSVLNVDSGAVVRTVVVGAGPSTMAVDERAGRAFVINTMDNSVSVLDARGGAVVRTVAVGTLPVDVALDEAGGRVWVVNEESNTVSVLDARSGIVLSTVAVGLAPSTVAVDGRSGHAFVLNGGGTSPATAAWNWVPRSLRRWLRIDAGPRAIPGSVSILGDAQ